MVIFATVLGYIGTLFLVLSFQCKKEKYLFLCQMCSGIFFVAHYGLLGDYTGMVMDGMAFLRSLCMASGKKFLSGKGMMCILLAVILGLCVITWADIFSIFPTIALFVSTVFLYTGNGNKIRRAQFFCTSPAWLTYNIYVHSIPGIICESLDMGSVAVYWIRARRAKKAGQPQKEQGDKQ